MTRLCVNFMIHSDVNMMNGVMMFSLMVICIIYKTKKREILVYPNNSFSYSSLNAYVGSSRIHPYYSCCALFLLQQW